MNPESPIEQRQDLCVLIPVYSGTFATHLRLALGSIERQTVRPGTVLVVQDGDLSAAHDAVIAAAGRRIEGLRILRLGRVGIVEALNAGLAWTNAEWVARMDADDIAEPNRLKLQLQAVAGGDVDVVGGAMREFHDDPGHPTAVRSAPESHEEIVRALRSMNPMNHPTVMMRRDVVMDVGGYVSLPGMEDYLLWANLAAAGARFRNLPDVLVRYRVDRQSYKRRADPTVIRAEWALQRRLKGLGLVGSVRSAANLVVRVGFRLLPPVLMRPAYAVVRSTLARRSNAAR